jgi:hypothetical protein
MRKLIWVASILALSVGALIWATPGRDVTRVPVLLELFTSEGCSSCPPADRLLESLDTKQPVSGAELIVLSEHVDYWNHLGWKDPFSSPQYSARQEEYVRKLGSGDVYTPQLVVDGRFQVVGSDSSEAASSVRKAIREPKIPMAISNITRAGDRVSARIDITASPQSAKAPKGILFVAIADNRDESQVARGENAGRSLAHVAVTRVLKQVGMVDPEGASTRDITLSVPPRMASRGFRMVTFIEDPGSGRVLGVAMGRFQSIGPN